MQCGAVIVGSKGVYPTREEGGVAITRPGVHFYVNSFSFVCVYLYVQSAQTCVFTCLWKPEVSTGCLPLSLSRAFH